MSTHNRHRLDSFQYIGLVLILTAILDLALLIGLAIKAEATPGNGQETCPHTDGWVKYDGLSGHSFTYPDQVPADVGVENCVKYATTVTYGTGVTVVSDGKHEISHAAFRVTVPVPEQEPTPGPTPTETPTPTAEPTPVPSPTQPPAPIEEPTAAPLELAPPVTIQTPAPTVTPDEPATDSDIVTTVKPEPAKPEITRETRCLGNALLTTVHKNEVKVSSSIVNGHASCTEQITGVVVIEEGM